MKYILIIWLSSVYDAGTYAEKLGAIESAEFKTKESCAVALDAVKAKAKFIDGVCTEL